MDHWAGGKHRSELDHPVYLLPSDLKQTANYRIHEFYLPYIEDLNYFAPARFFYKNLNNDHCIL
jgi:hypothetical protein